MSEQRKRPEDTIRWGSHIRNYPQTTVSERLTNTTQQQNDDAEAIRQQVARDRALAEKATPGPWETRHVGELYEDWPDAPDDMKWLATAWEGAIGPNLGAEELSLPNAEFIAASRQIVPTQADQVEALVEALEKVRPGLAKRRLLHYTEILDDALAAVRRMGERDE